MNEETLFELALNTPPAELPALLVRECASDPALRKRIEKLLAAHLASDEKLVSALEYSIAGFQVQSPFTHGVFPTIGSVLGKKYKLIELIGDGGMGSVYMAQQTEPVKRLVAVKVIKAGMDSRTVLARFEAERQALAMMDHPNIAKVLDAGATESGSPYFVMELVKGIPITQYCDENQLTPRQRLELFLPVCEAIQHSHQKGIIHRDIKPSNVLVAMYDERAIPKVIDFGVAKATERSLADVDLVTGFGALVGTPEYMSPEQAGFNNLDIDTRTDIYSLGVLLYELLSGHTPVDRKSMQKAAVLEILRIVRDEDAPLLSAKLSSIDTLPSVAANRRTEPKKLAMQFRGELDWVLHKALEKDRSRRYETASSLAQDIQRFLSNEIVEARPPSAIYSLQKFYQRNKGQVIAAGLVLLSLLAGIIGTTWGLIRAEQRRLEAEDARADEANQRRIAQANEVEAITAKEEEQRQRSIAEDEKQRAIESRNRALDALRATTGNDVEKLLGEKKALSQNERAYLEAIAERWKLFSNQQGSDELSCAIRAEGHMRVAGLWDHLGRLDDALLEYEQAEKALRELASDFPENSEHAKDLAACCNNLGLVFNRLGRHVEAQTKLREGLAINESLLRKFPDRAEFQVALSGGHHNMALVNQTLANSVEAVASYQRGIDIEAKLAADHPGEHLYHSRLATSYSNLGVLLRSLNKHQEATEQYQKALAIREKLAADFPTQTEYFVALSTSYHNFANLLDTLGQATDAINKSRQAVAIRETLVADYPGMPEYSSSLAGSYNNLGAMLRKQGKDSEADEFYQKALAIREYLAKTFPFEADYREDLSDTYKNLATLARTANKPALALELQLKAVQIREKLVVDFPAINEYRHSLSRGYLSLGLVLRRQNKLNEAEDAYRKGLDLLGKLHAQSSEVTDYFEDLASSHNGLANLLADKKMLGQALEHYEKAATIRESLVSKHPSIPDYKVELASVYGNRAIKLLDADQSKESIEWFEKAIDLLKVAHDSSELPMKSKSMLKDYYEGRSKSYDKIQKYAEAEADWNKVVELSPPKDKYDLLTKRWKRLLKQGLVNEAIEHIAQFAKMSHDDPNLLYELACTYSLAAESFPEKQTEYADRAVELLTQSIKLGFSNAKRLRNDADFKQLRERDDFKKLVSEVESERPTSLDNPCNKPEQER
ncbi:MAG: tetratricopeptide repeat protein [Pirellulales bacterium]